MNIPLAWLTTRLARPPQVWLSTSDYPAFRSQFEACDRLEEFVMKAISDPAGSFTTSENAIVKLAVARALHTFDALLSLADAGYGAPALALARTLIEESVAAWWLRTVPRDRTVELLQSHEQSYSLMLQGPDSPDVNYLPLLRGLAPMSADDVIAATKHFKVDSGLGRRHWTRKSVHKMVLAVREDMRPVERDSIDALTGKPLLIANLITHNSPLSMATRLIPTTEDAALTGRQTSRQPTTALVHEALASGYESMSLIAWLVRNAPDTEAADRLVREGRFEFAVLDLDGEPGRNEPCPCGSSKKYKRCHGAPGKQESGSLTQNRGWKP